MLKMNSLINWWRRTLVNLLICVSAIVVMLFLVQRIYIARLNPTPPDQPTDYARLIVDHQEISNTDNQISALQERLKQNPGDQLAYVRLGAAYLQKARETGDPTYYTKSDQVLHRALTLKPQDLLATVQSGGARSVPSSIS